MEFTTITKRVGEICGVDANAVEPDPRFVGAGGWRGRNGEAKDPPAPAPSPAVSRRAQSRRARAIGRGDAARARRGARRRAQRPRRSTSPPIPTVTTPAELERWIARAFDAGFVAFDTETSLARPDAGRSRRHLARRRAGRGLLHPDRPSRGRRRPVRRRRARAGPDRGSGGARAAEAAARGPGRAQDRPEREIRLACVRRSAASRSRRSTIRC